VKGLKLPGQGSILCARGEEVRHLAVQKLLLGRSHRPRPLVALPALLQLRQGEVVRLAHAMKEGLSRRLQLSRPAGQPGLSLLLEA